MKKKVIAAVLLFLVGVSPILAYLSPVKGQLGVNLFQVTPTQGVPGRTVNVQGTINTANGQYNLYLGNILVATNTSEGSYVNANFTVPELPGGDHTLTLIDVAQRINASSTFTIQTGYFINAIEPSAPEQLQEGNDVVLNLTVTGGVSGISYAANVTVILPDPLLTEYSQIVTLSFPNQNGSAQSQITYPSGNFGPSGYSTNFTGIYKAYFNKTQGLSVDEFFIGFTNLDHYHRDQPMAIRAVGYQSNQPVDIRIINKGTSENLYTENGNASDEGIISTSWTVPSNAEIGLYQVTIAPEGIQKSIIDSQNFTIPGYSVEFRTLNLAGENVPQILVEAADQATGNVYSSTSDSLGEATVNLEKGNHNVTAYWNDVRVGQISVFVEGENQHDLTCELTNLKITVQDKNGFRIPAVSLRISYRYTTRDSTIRTGNVQGQTDILGNLEVNSTLPRIDYIINASVYGRVFNSANSTFYNIPAEPTYKVDILFPSQNLTLTILDFNGEVIPDARLALGEITSGIFYVASTNTQAPTIVEVAFGIYQLRVYHGNVLLNETVIEVFSNVQSEILCILYNLPVSVLVVDYFGQPIPNMNVIYKGPDENSISETTQSNGLAVFDKVIGGEAQIIAYPTGQENYYEAVSLQVTSAAAVQVRMGKYILFGTLLLDISNFMTAIVILVVIILFLLFEIYRKRTQKSAKGKTATNLKEK